MPWSLPTVKLVNELFVIGARSPGPHVLPWPTTTRFYTLYEPPKVKNLTMASFSFGGGGAQQANTGMGGGNFSFNAPAAQQAPQQQQQQQQGSGGNKFKVSLHLQGRQIHERLFCCTDSVFFTLPLPSTVRNDVNFVCCWIFFWSS